MGASSSIIQVQSWQDQKEKTLYDAYKKLIEENHLAIGVPSSMQEEQVPDILYRAQEIAFGLIAMGVDIIGSPCIGIYFQTNLEYQISEQVCSLFNMIGVPLFDAIGPAACAYIINKARIQTIVCDRIVNVKALLGSIQETAFLNRIVLVEKPSDEIMNQAYNYKINIVPFSAVEMLGQSITRVTRPMSIKMCIPPKVFDRLRSHYRGSDDCITKQDAIKYMEKAEKCISPDSHCSSCVLCFLEKTKGYTDLSKSCAVSYLAKKEDEKGLEKDEYNAQPMTPMNSDLQLQRTGTERTVAMKNSYSQLENFAKNVYNMELKLRTEISWDGYILKLVVMYRRSKEKKCFVETFTEYGKRLDKAIENVVSKTVERSIILQAVKLVWFIKDNIKTRYYLCEKYQTGYALIVCITKGREGANQEIENIKRIMQKVLNFRCKFVIDPSYYEVNKIIKYTAAFLNRRTNSFYCFTFFITGHGDQTGVKVGDSILNFDHIIASFKNDAMPDFIGKPRAFFFNCCQGGKYGESHFETDGIQLSIEKDVRKLKIHTDGDIFAAYSTTDGYVSLRCKKEGSLFIESCARIFEKNYSTLHLEEMMIDVKADIGRKLEGTEKTLDGISVAQMPCTWSTLTRQFYLKRYSSKLKDEDEDEDEDENKR